MARDVTATEARTKLLVITCHGRRVARLEPATGGMALWGLHEGMVTIEATDEELSYGVEWHREAWFREFDDLCARS